VTLVPPVFAGQSHITNAEALPQTPLVEQLACETVTFNGGEGGAGEKKHM